MSMNCYFHKHDIVPLIIIMYGQKHHVKILIAQMVMMMITLAIQKYGILIIFGLFSNILLVDIQKAVIVCA